MVQHLSVSSLSSYTCACVCLFIGVCMCVCVHGCIHIEDMSPDVYKLLQTPICTYWCLKQFVCIHAASANNRGLRSY